MTHSLEPVHSAQQSTTTTSVQFIRKTFHLDIYPGTEQGSKMTTEVSKNEEHIKVGQGNAKTMME